jgi:hypothetical protein
MQRRIRIVCPLEIERRALVRTGLGGRFEIHRCGPGPDAVRRWVREHMGRGETVILAGLAGALKDDYKAGSAMWIDEVTDTSGRCWCAPIRDARAVRDGSPHTVVVGADRILASVISKRDAASRWNADLVDLESAAFADAADQAGAIWAIVRGVSDDARTSLPTCLENWTDESGRTHARRAALDVMIRPWLLIRLTRLAWHASRAMRNVAGLLESIPTEGFPKREGGNASHNSSITSGKQPSP